MGATEGGGEFARKQAKEMAKIKQGGAKDEPSKPVNLELSRAKGMSSQEFGEGGSEANEKFALLVRNKVIEREKLLGFELDDDDIKVIEKTLRVKYCGQGGLYGAC